MSDNIKIEVGGSLEDLGRRFVEACERAQAGEVAPAQTIVSFESITALTNVLNDRRLALMGRLTKEGPVRSVRALAGELGRDYAQVHKDVAALLAAGLVRREGRAISAAARRVEVGVDFAA